MRIYFFYDAKCNLVWHLPWRDKDPPIIVESICRNEKEGDEVEEESDFNVH